MTLCDKLRLMTNLSLLEKIIIGKQTSIEAWFRDQWRKTLIPLYASVDLRNAGFKMAPVDTNLFPGGFNNLNAQAIPLAIQAMGITLEKLIPGCKRLLLIPENHTRNLHYLENVYQLQQILQNAGYEVRIGSLLPDFTTPTQFDLPSGKHILLETIQKIQPQDQATKSRLKLENFSPCAIILNHDLSEGVPDLLTDIAQTILPAVTLGWHQRRKSHHFHHYQHITEAFAAHCEMDPWLIDPYFTYHDAIDFQDPHLPETLFQQVDEILFKIQQKYNQYGLTQTPFVAIKANAGTYGMGVMMVKNSDELRKLNRKQRTRMGASKGRQTISSVLIQEGIPTIEIFGDSSATAEPVVYMIGSCVVGGFYRVHEARGDTENLNAPGMAFHPIPFTNACNNPNIEKPDCLENRFYVYSVIARLALLAASYEKEQQQPCS